MCGLPGYGPGDLIDFEFSGDTIKVTFSAGIDEPLRLTSPEATGLLMALRALVDVPGVVDPEAAPQRDRQDRIGGGHRRRTDRQRAVGRTGAGARGEPGRRRGPRRRCGTAARCVIEYYSASRDTLSSRVVDPIRVVLVGDHSYLEAWSREAEGVRLFRFDRIVDAACSTSLGPAGARRAGGAGHVVVRRRPGAARRRRCGSRRQAAWMLEYYPMRVLRELPDG